MTLQPPKLTPATERDLIVAMVAARLDRLVDADDSRAAAERITEADQAYAALPGGGALTGLLALFDATEADRAVLLTCLAAEFDPRLLTRYHQVTGRGWATEWLAAILFARPGQMLLAEGSALLRWQLIQARADQPGEPPALTADPAIRGWLAGRIDIPLALAAKAEFRAVLPPLADWPVLPAAERVGACLARGLPVLLSVSALEGAGRATFAANVAQALGQPLIAVDPGAGGTAWTREDTALIQRLTRVANAALLWRALPPAGCLAPLDRAPPMLQVLTLGPGDPLPDPGPLAPFEIVLPPMRPAERAAMIAAEVPTAGAWSEATRALLATRDALTPAAIVRLGHVAPATDAEAIEATNRTQAAVMGSLAERLTSDLGWDDLILPETLTGVLQDLAFEARTRRHAWSAPGVARLFARERGLVGLFHGPPGTGKTMAAQVVAHEMGVDLYRIDCGAVISKYIGETAKNMGAIFARARQIDAVLFFDEADALFSRRTEVKDSNDRHANADTAYLLQLIEGGFDGTALLATNRKSDMDAAFLRRIRYSFEFPRPGAEARTAIWQRAAAALAPDCAAALAGLWPILGTSLEITGAQIKTTLLAAYFAAERQGAPLDPAAILRAAERELMKEGRTLGVRDRERIRAHA
jgi:ATPase family associated with various cellular activities (AAA)